MLFMILLGLSLAPANFAADIPSVDAGPPGLVADASELGSLAPKDCAGPTTHMADRKDRGARARRLDQLPTGRLEYAVFREVDGCAIPAVVHENIGPRPAPDRGSGR